MTTTERPRQMKRIRDPEIRALRDVMRIMDKLDRKQCERFVAYLTDKYQTNWRDNRPERDGDTIQ